MTDVVYESDNVQQPGITALRFQEAEQKTLPGLLLLFGKMVSLPSLSFLLDGVIKFIKDLDAAQQKGKAAM